ncbi:hypothetical protein K440DRAFT_64698 [Wilcoxina mikolae CBS 423.85]|nr:hypothetical protein K440DRAFT_64698 [Wilcoxina mikolae CBS 423.85]
MATACVRLPFLYSPAPAGAVVAAFVLHLYLHFLDGSVIATVCPTRNLQKGCTAAQCSSISKESQQMTERLSSI